MLKKTYTQLTGHREAELVPTYCLHPYLLTSILQEGILHTAKGVNTNLATNPAIYSGVLPARYVSSMMAQSLWGKPTYI